MHVHMVRGKYIVPFVSLDTQKRSVPPALLGQETYVITN